MIKPLNTLFVIADGARARWVRHSRAVDDFVTIKVMTHEEPPHGHPQGVAFESSTGRAFNIEPARDAARRSRVKFAEAIAEAINADPAVREVERVAIVAPTRILKTIVEHVSGPVREKLAATLAKDLAKTPDHFLGRWIRKLEMG